MSTPGPGGNWGVLGIQQSTLDQKELILCSPMLWKMLFRWPRAVWSLLDHAWLGRGSGAERRQ